MTRRNMVRLAESGITIIRGRHEITTNILYILCIDSVSNNRNVIFIDCSNTFNPYIISRMAKLIGINQKEILCHIEVARAFTEYQIEYLISDLSNIIQQKNPEILVISNLSILYENYENENYKNFKKVLENIKYLTNSTGIITVISDTDNSSVFCKQLIESVADKILLSNDINIGNTMGRTVPSFRFQLEEIVSELQIFRRALHGEDKKTFDILIDKARKHASSCTIVPTLDPLNCILLSILIEQQKEINSLQKFSNDKDLDKDY